MTEAVRDCFPDVPEKCLSCPGLAEAALNLQAHQSSADKLAEMSAEADAMTAMAVGVRAVGAARLLDSVAETALMHARAVRALGWLLYASCFDGVQEGRQLKTPKLHWVPGRRRGVVEATLRCGSSSPMADFLPVFSTKAQRPQG